ADFDAVAILGYGRQQGLLQKIVPRLLVVPLFVFVALSDLRIGMDDDQTGRPVDDDLVIGANQGGDVFQAKDGGNFDGTGNDRRMGGLAAHIGGESQDLVDLHLRRVGGREVRGNDNDPFPEFQYRLLFAGKIGENPLAGMLDIADPTAEIIIV